MTNMGSRAIGVLLDFDGVVVDSMPVHLNAWQEAYQSLFQSDLAPTDLAHLMGRSTAYIANYLCGLQGCSWRAADLAQLKSRTILHHLHDVELLPGSQEFCEHLISLGLPFGIVSNAPRSFIEQTIHQCQLKVPFFFGIEDYKRAKPHPDPYLMGARQIQVEFSQYYRILTFEDSTHGLKAACQAFTTAIGITSQHTDDVLLQAGACQTFANLAEALSQGILETPLQKRL
ncbi:MAG: HAD family hydrolase [Oligoflexus sp.]